MAPTVKHDSKSDSCKSDESNDLHGDSKRHIARPYERPTKMPEFDVKRRKSTF